MTERLLDLSDAPARLTVQHDQLVVRRGDETTTVPLEEIGALVVSHPAVTYTQAALTRLCEYGGAFIACDTQRMPIAMMLPLEGHHLQTERLEAQVSAGQPLRKRLWQQLAQHKIISQGRCLEALHGGDGGLPAMAKRVKSGDPENVEAQAARRYWPLLFADTTFRRNRDLPGANALLNYGYAVLRATVGRAIVAAGLHPSIGIHHHNRYDAFCLADDLMEPHRALVDRAVAGIVQEFGMDAELDKETKRPLLEALTGRYVIDEEERSLFDIAGITAVSLVHVFQGKRKRLRLPEM